MAPGQIATAAPLGSAMTASDLKVITLPGGTGIVPPAFTRAFSVS
jgi:hypothetical protein